MKDARTISGSNYVVVWTLICEILPYIFNFLTVQMKFTLWEFNIYVSFFF